MKRFKRAKVIVETSDHWRVEYDASGVAVSLMTNEGPTIDGGFVTSELTGEFEIRGHILSQKITKPQEVTNE